MTGISTHVLNTAIGKPAQGVPVTLERNEPDAGWIPLGKTVTDANGRIGQFDSPGVRLSAGEYRLWFDVRTYFASRGETAFFPEVTIHFDIRDEESHYHVPLLLSPYGYSTYRGS